jgi:hypothetical protein
MVAASIPQVITFFRRLLLLNQSVRVFFPYPLSGGFALPLQIMERGAADP